MLAKFGNEEGEEDAVGSPASSFRRTRMSWGMAVYCLLLFWLRPLLSSAYNRYNKEFSLFTPQDFRAMGFARLTIYWD